MKKIILILLMIIISQNCFSQEQENSNEEKIEISSVDKKNISFLFGLESGKMLFAPSTSIDAEFNSFVVNYSKVRESNLETNFSLDYMFNQSQSKFINLKAGLGYNFNINENVQIIPSIQAGISFYKEQTPNQNINAFGKSFALKTDIIYNIRNNFGAVISFDYSRIMISSGYSPKDPSGEMVYQYMSSKVGLFWEL